MTEAAGAVTAAGRRRWAWPALAVGVTWTVWLAAVVVEPRRFVAGDTESAYFGWLWQLGTALRHGEWPLLDVGTMSAGNHVAEGQMGLYNPLMALLGLGATVTPDFVVYLTVVKFLLAAVAVCGAYALARSYDVPAPLSAAAATAATLCGLTFTCEAPRWFDGFLQVSLLPWAWVLTRRAIRGRSPLPALALCGLVVTVGYVYGALYLVVVLGACLLEALVAKDRRGLLVGVLIASFSGLLMVVVFLPGVLSLPVTMRHQTVQGGRPGLFRLLPWQLALLGQPVGDAPSTNSLGGLPWRYVVWFLPLVVLAPVASVRRLWRGWIGPAAAAVVMLGWSLLPNELGPLRWPGRTLDFLALAVVTALVVVLRDASPPSRRRIGLVACLCLGGTVVQALVASRHVVLVLVTGAAILVALVGVCAGWRSLRRVGATLLAGSLVIGVVQAFAYPSIGVHNRAMPADTSAYAHYLPGARGATLVIDEVALGSQSDPYVPVRARYSLSGSLWALTGKHVVNGYSTIGFRAYSARFCALVGAEACPRALDAMLSVEPRTQRARADLYSISTLVVGHNPRTLALSPPAGWHVAGRNPYASTWVRDRVLPLPGGVSWHSPGVRLHGTRTGDLGASFVVDAVPAGGGVVVLSRLAWPGYRVSGAELAAPVDGSLLTVRLSPGDVHQRVAVTFRPPGWAAELACLALALLVALLAVVVSRRPRATPAVDPSP